MDGLSDRLARFRDPFSNSDARLELLLGIASTPVALTMEEFCKRMYSAFGWVWMCARASSTVKNRFAALPCKIRHHATHCAARRMKMVLFGQRVLFFFCTIHASQVRVLAFVCMGKKFDAAGKLLRHVHQDSSSWVVASVLHGAVHQHCRRTASRGGVDRDLLRFQRGVGRTGSVVFDIDDTLIDREQRRIPAIAPYDECRRLGLPIYLVTARPEVRNRSVTEQTLRRQGFYAYKKLYMMPPAAQVEMRRPSRLSRLGLVATSRSKVQSWLILVTCGPTLSPIRCTLGTHATNLLWRVRCFLPRTLPIVHAPSFRHRRIYRHAIAQPPLQTPLQGRSW